MNGETLLAVEDLSVYYYTLEGVVKAVRNLNFQLGKGEILCLVGESGSGKSTVGLAISGALPENAMIASGKIIFNDIDLLRLPEEKLREIQGREISIIFQDPAATLNPLFTIGSILTDVIKTHLGITEKDKVKKLALEMLKIAGLPDPERIYNSYPHELSGGMLQRAIIAVALSTRPKLLIADEPTTMLDVTLQAQILDLLLDLQKKFKLSILFITHNLGVAAEIADRILVMYAGIGLEEASTYEILRNPLHPYTKGLIECVPRCHIRVSKLRYIPGSLPDLRNPPPGCPFHPRCPYAMDICKREEPPMIEVKTGHRVWCHLYSKR
ncbi:MAG: ABC transporter ATP-binding protein [Thermoprotei archaeon]|nr:MAG: ABC transporter ATP-binding protein [Thermoprotei archaeon]